MVKLDVNKKQLAIVKQLDNICIKHNIKYYADGGTLIGCYRHNGFIPHDVDMDFMMTRENFNKFLKVVDKELQHPYVFSSPYKGDFGYGLVNRIFDTETTYFCNKKHENKARNLAFHAGIFIDIFVFDKVPEDWDERCKFAEELNCSRININNFVDDNIDLLKEQNSKALEEYKILVNKYLTLCGKYNDTDSSVVGDTTVTKFNRGAVWFKHWIEGDSNERVKFEDIYLPVPENGKRCLDNLYPHWNELVIDTHTKKPFVDPYNSYIKYINGELESNYDISFNNRRWNGK